MSSEGADHRVVRPSWCVVLAGVVGVSVIRDRRSKVAVQTQKVAPPGPGLDGLRLGRGQAQALREHQRQRLRPHHAPATVKEGDARQEGPGAGAHRLHALRGGRRASRRRPCRRRGPTSQRAQADLEVTQLAFERSKQMHDEKLVSDQAFDQADAELKMKAAAVESQQRRIAQQAGRARHQPDDLEKTTVVAPMDGVVTSLPKEEGEVRDRRPELLAHRDHDRGRPLGDGGRGPGGRDRHPQRARWARRPRCGWTRSRASKIKGEVTEIGSSAIPRGASAAAATARPRQHRATRPRTSRSWSPSRTRRPPCARA